MTSLPSAHSRSCSQPFPANRRAIFLVGFMACGKTSVGRTLAEKLNWKFIDLDDRIQEQGQCTIAEIFAREGEAGFRRAEAEELGRVLESLSESARAVVALGGGAYVQRQNAKLLARFGAPVIFLDAPVEELWRRAQESDTQRPLAAEQNQFRQLYEQRRRRYMEADLRLNTAGRSFDEIAGEIISQFGLEAKEKM